MGMREVAAGWFIDSLRRMVFSILFHPLKIQTANVRYLQVVKI